MKKIFLLTIILFLLLSGCVDLVKNGEETISLTYSKNGTVRIEHKIQGEKGTLYFNWDGDCTQQAKAVIDSNISNFQTQSLEIKNSTNLTETEKTELIEENNRKINTLLSIKSTVKCNLEQDANGMAKLNYSFNLSQGFENISLFNNNYDFTLIKSDKKIESTIKVNDTANITTGNLLKKLEIYSENGIEKIEPADKYEVNSEGIYSIEMLGLDGQEISLTINRDQYIPPKGDDKKPDSITILIQGFTPEKLISLEKEDPIQWIPTILLTLIIIISIAKLTKYIKIPKDTKTVSKEQALEDKVLSKTSKVAGPKNAFEYMSDVKKPVQKTIRPKFSEEEKKQIKTIIVSLKESFHNYSKEEIKKAILGKGYSDKIAQEIADFFYS